LISIIALTIRLSFNISTISEIWILLFYLVFVYPSEKPIIPHGLRPDPFGVFVIKDSQSRQRLDGFALDVADMEYPRLSLI
jgi:hypothetical protein